jgi:excisionase family DNA binding protein
MSTFSVELTFKIAGREVAPDQFVEAIAAKTLENLRREIEGLRSSQAAMPRVALAEREKQPRAVGIDRAAELLGLSKRTIWKYVSQRKLRSVRFGRRILIPMETLEMVLRNGLTTR